MSDKAIFLDRDDTLIEDPGYISDPEQVKLIDGVASALVYFRKMGFRIIVVSNQSAVARGIITERKLGKIHDTMKQLLAEKGAFLDGIYYCPYHPGGAIPKYRKDSEDRKPAPGMLLTAANEMDIELAESWMIGDSPRDIEAGFRAGCRTILVELPSRQRRTGGFTHLPDYRAINLKEAVNIVKKYGHVARKSKDEAKQTEPDEVRIEMSSSEIETEDSGRKAEETAPETPVSQTQAIVPERDKSPASDTVTQPDHTSEREHMPVPEPRAQEEKSNHAKRHIEEAMGQSGSISVESESRQTSAVSSEHHDRRESLRATEARLPGESSTEDLLAAILDELRSMQRKELYGEFSVMRLMAGIVQVLVLFCLVITVWFLMSPKSQDGAVLLSLGFGAVLQLMALTFYTMHGRK